MNSVMRQQVSGLKIGCKEVLSCFIVLIINYIDRNLLSYIKAARKSIDICVYCISCFEIADVVLKRHKVGVKVRVITDLSMEVAHGSQNPRFMKDGIPNIISIAIFNSYFLNF